MNELLIPYIPHHEHIRREYSVPDIFDRDDYVRALFHFFCEWVKELADPTIIDIKLNSISISYDDITRHLRVGTTEDVTVGLEGIVNDSHNILTFTHDGYEYRYESKYSMHLSMGVEGRSDYSYRSMYDYELIRTLIPERDIYIITLAKLKNRQQVCRDILEKAIHANRDIYQNAHNLMMDLIADALDEVIELKPNATQYSCTIPKPEALHSIINPHYLAVYIETWDNNSISVNYDEMYNQFLINVSL